MVTDMVRHSGNRSDSPGRGADSRGQSPVRFESGRGSSSDPSSGAHTPVESSISPPNAVTTAIVEKKAKATVEEFLQSRDCKVSCIKENFHAGSVSMK